MTISNEDKQKMRVQGEIGEQLITKFECEVLNIYIQMKSCTSSVPIKDSFPLLLFKQKNIHRIQFPQPNEKDLAFLVEHGSPSHFGKDKKNVYDQSYRKATEFLPNEIFLSPFILETVLNDAIHKTSRQLASNQYVRAQLIKLNVYQQGGMFKDHVDTPKGHAFGSLVIFLPSPFEGGQLVIKGDEKIKTKYCFGQTKGEVNWVSFYNDCVHQVQPVLKGLRLTLSYNLFMEPLQKIPATVSIKLRQMVQEMISGKIYGFYCQHLYNMYSIKKLIEHPMTVLKGEDQQFYSLVKDFQIQIRALFKIQDYAYGQQEQQQYTMPAIHLSKITKLIQDQDCGFDEMLQDLQKSCPGMKICDVDQWLNDKNAETQYLYGVRLNYGNQYSVNEQYCQIYIQLTK